MFKLLLVLVFIVGCTPSKKIKPLKAQGADFSSILKTDEQKKAHQCFKSSQEFCDSMKAVSFNQCMRDQSSKCMGLRVPANIEHQLDIASMNWFFLSPSKIAKTVRFVKSLKKIRTNLLQSAHGYGIGITPQVFIGAGFSYTGEAILFKKQIDFFCAPGIIFTPDVGAQINFSKIRTVQCKNKKDYLGKFMTLSVGVDANTLGLPVGLNLGYSLGIDIEKFLNSIKQNKHNIDWNHLDGELITFINGVKKEHKATAVVISSLLLQMMPNYTDYKISASQLKDAYLSLSKARRLSIGNQIKDMLDSDMVHSTLVRYKLGSLEMILQSLSNSLSGCDSKSAALTLGLTLSPLNVGLMLSHYEHIGTLSLDKLKGLGAITTTALLNPFLMSNASIYFALKMYRESEKIENNIINRCNEAAVGKAQRILNIIDEI